MMKYLDSANLKTVFLNALLLIMPGISLSVTGEDLVKNCVACHGDSGVSKNPQWPNLAGQKPAYLQETLRLFRDGKRKDRSMAPFVNKLSDQDIRQLANFYSAQPLPVSASGDVALVQAGKNAAAYCVACHGMRGISANSEWPNLAGQQAEYLVHQLQAFRDGERDSLIMQNIVADYSDERFRELAAYYSQLRP